jgi:phenylpyruvate tautomerase PptA (4-oxalocrotonate tautomerase family)
MLIGPHHTTARPFACSGASRALLPARRHGRAHNRAERLPLAKEDTMPLVRIDLPDTAPETLGPSIGDLIYQVMTETINVPEDDKFQVIARHSPGQLVHPRSYLGIEYSAGFVLIQITLNQGRSIEMKKAFYRRVADGLHEQLGIRREDVFISLVEVVKENWSFGNGEMQYA